MAFELQVKLTGLCMFAIQKARQSIVVVMPDTRFRRDKHGSPVPMKHPDGEPAVPHVGYLRFNLANLHPKIANVPPTNIATAPPYEVIHRFNRESLKFGLGKGGTEDITNHGLQLPDFDDFAPVKQPIPSAFTDPPTAPNVLMRTELTGGYLSSSGEGEDWYMTGELHPDGQRRDGKFSGDIEWIRKVEADELTLTIERFKPEAGEKPVVIKLKPTPVGGDGPLIIPLKIANLCSTNPMEWDELDLRAVHDADRDFKWFYQLVEVGPNHDPTQYPASVVPHPRPVRDIEAKEGILVDCWPSKISL